MLKTALNRSAASWYSFFPSNFSPTDLYSVGFNEAKGEFNFSFLVFLRAYSRSEIAVSGGSVVVCRTVCLVRALRYI